METLAPLPSRLHPLARRHARLLERMHQAHNQALAGRVEDIFAGLNLSQRSSSIGGGRSTHVPEVLSVTAGPPVGLNIHILPGQMAEDFAAHAATIAYSVGVAEVRVIPLGPSLIRLELR
jgi:hypothetical protein